MNNINSSLTNHHPSYKVFSDLVGIFFNHIKTYKVIKTLQEITFNTTIMKTLCYLFFSLFLISCGNNSAEEKENSTTQKKRRTSRRRRNSLFL